MHMNVMTARLDFFRVLVLALILYIYLVQRSAHLIGRYEELGLADANPGLFIPLCRLEGRAASTTHSHTVNTEHRALVAVL